MAHNQKTPRRLARTVIGWTLFCWTALLASVVSAGQDPNALIILLNVSTDGRTLNITQMPAAGFIAPPAFLPPAPPKGPPVAQQPPPLPPAPPAPPRQKKIGIVDVFTRLNVRTGPSTNHTILGTLGPGDPIDILATSPDGWFNITWRGRSAWVCGDWVFRPGEKLHNGAIRPDIRQHLGADAVPPAPPPPPAAAEAPAGSGDVGARAGDGGLKIPFYNQYAVGARVPSGFCGPTSLKMVLEYFGIKKPINFLGDADVGGATPVYTSGQGAGHQAMLDMLRHCGLKGSYMTHAKSIDWLRQQTAAGKPVVVSVKGNFGGGYYTAGHILVVSGVTPDGRVILNDSVGGKRRIVSGSAFLGAWNSSNRMAIVAQQ